MFLLYIWFIIVNLHINMKIYKFSRILSIIPAVIFGWFMYKMFMDHNFPYIAWAILPAAILALLYLFQPQIDYWWLDRNPIELSLIHI